MSPPIRALILLIDGIEELEAIGPCDVLRRAGIQVTMAGLNGTDPVTCSQKSRILPDVAVDDVMQEKYDVVVLPGGQYGSLNLAKSPKVGEILQSQVASGGYIAAICAASLAFGPNGIQKGATVTSHPLVKHMIEEAGYKYSEDRVVVDGKLITSRAPGTIFDFAFKIVEILVGNEEAKKIKEFIIL